MAYFLKKTKNKKGIYLQIYESYYDPERKGGAHRSYKPIGYVHELQAGGITDPISFYGDEVTRLNQEYKKAKQEEKSRQISEESPEKLLGYFPLKNINDSLGCKKYINLMQTATDFRFNVSDMLSALIYARIVHPCSKSKTYDEVIPKLFEETDFSGGDLFVLPGGGEGTQNLGACVPLGELLKEKYAAGKRVAAICAAPSVLASLGLLEGKKATVYPGMEDQLGGADYQDVLAVTDGLVTTGHGPGAAIDFGLELIRQIKGEEKAAEIREQLVYQH